jgi:hypothetical protein
MKFMKQPWHAVKLLRQQAQTEGHAPWSAMTPTPCSVKVTRKPKTGVRHKTPTFFTKRGANQNEVNTLCKGQRDINLIAHTERNRTRLRLTPTFIIVDLGIQDQPTLPGQCTEPGIVSD